MAIFKNKYIKFFLCFILVCSISLNFSLPSHSVALTATAGYFLFAKVCAIVGITGIAGVATSKVTKEGIDLYKDWMDFNERQSDPSPNPEDKGFGKKVLAGIMGLGVVTSFNKLKNSIVGFFNHLKAKPGNNPIPVSTKIGNVTFSKRYELRGTFNEISLANSSSTENYQHLSNDIYYKFHVGLSGYKMLAYFDFARLNPINGSYTPLFRSVTPGIQFQNSALTLLHGYVNINYSSIDNKLQSTCSLNSATHPSVYEDIVHDVPDFALDMPTSSNRGNYFVTNNSYILSKNDKDLKKMSVNIDSIKDLLEKSTNEKGNAEYKYTGDIEYLLEQILDRLNEDKLFVEGDTNIKNEGDDLIIEDTDNIYKPGSDTDTDTDNSYDDTNLINTIKNIFVTDDPLPLNFEPLMDIPIKDKFPFSLPWDIGRSVNILVRPPKPIKFTVPMVTEKITIDLSTFDKWALITRTFLSIIFIIGLVILTRHFIGGA